MLLRFTQMAACAALLAACAPQSQKTAFTPKPTYTAPEFSESEVEWFTKAGTGSIKGQAFFMTKGGTPRTCAGNEVTLVPQSAYASGIEFAQKQWKTYSIKGVSHPPVYYKYRKTAICNVSGAFEFKNLPAGNYIVETVVLWSIPGDIVPQGGALIEDVAVSSGESKDVVMSGKGDLIFILSNPY